MAEGNVPAGTFHMRMLEAEAGYERTDPILDDMTSYNESVCYRAVAASVWRKSAVAFVAVEDEPAGGA